MAWLYIYLRNKIKKNSVKAKVCEGFETKANSTWGFIQQLFIKILKGILSHSSEYGLEFV